MPHVIIFNKAQKARGANYRAKNFDHSNYQPALFPKVTMWRKDWDVIFVLVMDADENGRRPTSASRVQKSDWSAQW